MYIFTHPKKQNEDKDKDKENDISFLNHSTERPSKNKKKRETYDYQLYFPSSFYSSMLYHNNTPHPIYLFYDLYTKRDDDKQQDFEPDDADYQNNIISLLTEYYNVDKVRFNSLLRSNYDSNDVINTWNNRFPECKSQHFFSVTDQLIIGDIDSLKSLHLLGYQLNTRIFIIYSITSSQNNNNNKEKCYNIILFGPEKALYDIHLISQPYVHFVKEKLTGNNNNNYVTRCSECFLKFKIFDFHIKIPNSAQSEQQNNKEKSDNPNLLFLPRLSKPPIIFFNSLITQNLKGKSELVLNVSNNSSLKLTIQKLKEDKFEIYFSFPNESAKFNNLFKIIQFNSNQNSNTHSDNNNNLSIKENDLIAESNHFSFLAKEAKKPSPYSTITMNKQIRNFINNNNFDTHQDLILYGNLIRNRLLKYEDIKDHPYLLQKCILRLAYFETLGDVFKTEKDQQSNKERQTIEYLPKLDIPQYFNETFYHFVKYRQNDPSLKKKYFNQFKSIFPQLLKKPDSETDEIYCPLVFHASLTCKCNYISAAIEQIKKKKIGLNPIIMYTIDKIFNEASLSACINYFTNTQEIQLNPNLISDVKDLSEFKNRTTKQYWNNESALNANIHQGFFPPKYETVKSLLESMKDEYIPDAPVEFSPNFDNKVKEFYEIQTRKCTKLKLIKTLDTYQYTIYPILNDGIISPISLCTFSSLYFIKYLYITQKHIIAIGSTTTSDQNQFYIGFCRTMDSEIIFSENGITGEFISSIYYEDKKVIIISYKLHNDQNTYINAYDIHGNSIQESPTIFEKDIKSMVMISEHYFCVSFSQDLELDFSVFCFRDQEIFEAKSENWRLRKNPLLQLLLQERSKDSRCFICNKTIDKTNVNKLQNVYRIQNNKITSVINEFESHSNEQSSEECNIPKLPFQIQNLSNNQNIEEKYLFSFEANNNSSRMEEFTKFHINCALIEYFPSLIIEDGRILSYNSHFSYYLFDHQQYKCLPYKIYSFYNHMYSKISLFSVENLFNKYQLNKGIHLSLIVETSKTFKVGAKFASLKYGIAFDSAQENEVWCSLSLLSAFKTIVLYFNTNDISNIIKSLKVFEEENNDNKNNKNYAPQIYFCGDSSQAIENIINNVEDIAYSKTYIIQSSTFDFKSNDTSSKDKIIYLPNNSKSKDTEINNNIFKTFSELDESTTESFDIEKVKKLLSLYLTFQNFPDCPFETIRKYYCNINEIPHVSKKL